MRSPIPDQQPGATGPTPTPTEEGDESGGKAIERLTLFSAQRGFTVAAPIVEQVQPPPPEHETSIGMSRTEIETDDAGSFAATDVAEMYVEAMEQLEEAKTELAPAFAPPAWRLIGPTLIPNGQTYGSGRADVSGRVSAVAIDPSNSNHILCGSAGGGIWETRNAGGNWSPRTDHQPTLTTGAIAFDPGSPNVVYAGTGEGDFYAGLGAGLLRSTNGGSSWSMQATAPFVGSGFHDLLIDPHDGSHILAATTSGLYVSTDSGANWSRERFARTWSLSMDPRRDDDAEILAACADGLYRSTDGGDNWTQVSLPSDPGSWTRLAVDHVHSDPDVAYLFGASGSTAYLYRRASSGNWQRISTPADLAVGQAWYDWFLAAAPDRTNQVYLGAINMHRGDLSGVSWNWTNLSAKTSGDSIHPDQHAIAILPTQPDVVVVGNDGGLYRSTNRGINWTSLNRGLAITEFEYIAQDPGSVRWLMGGTQDNGTNRYHGSLVWDHIADGDGGDCYVNTINPDIIFHSFFRMGLERSTDRGATWRWIPTANRDPSVYRQLFYPPMDGRGNTVAQAGESIFISRDNANTWNEVAIPNRRVASAIYVPTPDVVYVGTTDGRIYRSSWSSSSWGAPVEVNSPRTLAWVSDLHVDPSNTSRIWATYSSIGGGRVFSTTDGGSNWTDRSAGLPNLPINAVEVDPSNANRVWIAADVGVYQSFNGGATWNAFSNGLPNMLVVDLVYHRHARRLRAGTRNRSVWEIDVNGRLSQPVCGRQWTGSLGPNQSRRWFTFNWPATWHVIWNIMPTTVRRGAPQVRWNVQVERANAEYVTYWITVTNMTNRNLTFDGRYCILSWA